MHAVNPGKFTPHLDLLSTEGRSEKHLRATALQANVHASSHGCGILHVLVAAEVRPHGLAATDSELVVDSAGSVNPWHVNRVRLHLGQVEGRFPEHIGSQLGDGGKLHAVVRLETADHPQAGLQVAHRLDEADSAIGAAAHVAMNPPDGDVQIFRIPAFVLRYDRRQGQQLLQSRPWVVDGLDAKEGDPWSAQHAQHALPHIGSDLAEGSLFASDAHRVQRRGGRHMPPRRVKRRAGPRRALSWRHGARRGRQCAAL